MFNIVEYDLVVKVVSNYRNFLVVEIVKFIKLRLNVKWNIIKFFVLEEIFIYLVYMFY